ncbi:MAG: translocation/assembly module TamB [Bacteroidales bacterium]|nr:translocation/assembly module TamB [Bacteroidales bacterium]
MRYLSYLIIVLSILPIISWGILQIPTVQNFAVSRMLDKVSENFGNKMNFSGVYVNNINKVSFKDLLITDNKNDTVIYSVKTVVIMPVLLRIISDRRKNQTVLRELRLEDSYLVVGVDTAGKVNLKFLVDYIKNNRDPLKARKPFFINKIRIKDSQFNLRNKKPGKERKGIDFTNLHLDQFNLVVKDMMAFADTVRLSVESLNFIDKSGFALNDLEGEMDMCKTHLWFDNITIQTALTEIEAEKIHMDFSKFKDFQTDALFEKVTFDMKFKESNVNLFDIGFFSDLFWNNFQSVTLLGGFNGPLSNFKGNQFIIGWGESSFIQGNLDINGLPDINETFLIFDLNRMFATMSDLKSFNFPGNKSLEIPSVLKKFNSFSYKGNFTGFFNDFVAQGKLTSNLGNIYTDVLFAPDTLNQVRFSGLIRTNGFNIGHLMESNSSVGDISIDAEIKGLISKDKPPQADVIGRIDKFTYRNYPYRNIEINGAIANKKFNGSLKASDPNLSMEFNGLVDLSGKQGVYDFDANVIDANLYELNISDSDKNYHASFLIEAKAKGNSFDSLNGEIKLLNSLFSKTDKQIQIYDINVIAQNDEEINELIIRSDILDANISGKYFLRSIKDDFISYLSDYLPAIIDSTDLIGEKDRSLRQINFDITFKYTVPFFDFFFPDYFISGNSKLKGTFSAGEEGFLIMNLQSPETRVQKNTWEGLVMNMNSDKEKLKIEIGSRVFSFNDRLDLENFTVNSSIKENKAAFKTRWLNWDSTLYKGVISGVLLVSKKDSVRNYFLNLDSTDITISDSVWHLNQCEMLLSSSRITVDEFKLEKNYQYLMAHGNLSDTEGDSLFIDFKDFNLANINFFTRKKDFEFAGLLNGQALMTGMKKKPLFFSALSITGLYINQEEFGSCSVRSLWNNKRQSLNIDAEVQNGGMAILKFSGDYYPALNGKMDFRIRLNKLKTDVFNPFLLNVFTDVRGHVSGNLTLTGFKGKPTLTGKMDLRDNAFTVNYLKTRYNFTSKIDVINNNFIFSNADILDREGNVATMNGMIRTEYLKNINLNLAISANNLLCLDSKSIDNDQFYGTAYTTGSIHIKGHPSSLRFDIDAETNRNTRFFIPLSQEDEVSEYDFVQFVRRDTVDQEVQEIKKEFKVDQTGMQMDFNLNVTPDAEVQLIFDPQMGDIIKASGNGEMKLTIDTRGTFRMVGEYVIEKGDYLFTLQDIINKKLKIQQGSVLRWSGDPLNAQIDITAVYRTKASLIDLFGYSDESYEGRVTVDCQVFLTGSLLSPDIKYDIQLPYADQEVQSRVESKITSDEEVSKQFLSLLVLSRFYLADQSSGNIADASSTNIAEVNASELLSNQLSNWLSQISNDFDIGVNYRPGSGTTTENEVEIALSTQVLNDRVSINGSVDMTTNAEASNASKFAGDFDVDYKINKSGKVRIRAFRRTNDDILNNNSPVTSGLGVFYREDFNTFGELMNKYWAVLSGKKKKKKKQSETH